MGGEFLAIYFGFSYIYHSIIILCFVGQCGLQAIIFPFIMVFGTWFRNEKEFVVVILKWFDNILILVCITLFIYIPFNCKMCVSLCDRTMNTEYAINNCGNDWKRNDLVFTNIIVVWTACCLDIVLHTTILCYAKGFWLKFSELG